MSTKTQGVNNSAKKRNTKYKLDRKIGQNILGRPQSSVNKRDYKPGMHGMVAGKKAVRNFSDYGIQLNEKRKIGHFYELATKPLETLIKEAIRRPGASNENLVRLLELRLSSVVYRLKFAISPRHARQLVVHGHVKVNGKMVSKPSYTVREGDVITLDEYMRTNAHVIMAHNSTERAVPDYLKVSGFGGSLIVLPTLLNVTFPVPMRFDIVIGASGR